MNEGRYFHTLKIRNVRCFKDEQTLDLTGADGKIAQWTVLIGDNGTGKTTLLRALAAMQPVLILARNGTRVVPLLNQLHSEKLPNLRFADVSHRTGAEIRATIWESDGLKQSTCKSLGDIFILNTFTDSTDIVTSNNEATSGTLVYSYGASRRNETASFLESDNFGQDVEAFDDSRALVNAEEWLLWIDYAVQRQEPRAKERQEKIHAALCALLPGVNSIKYEKRDPTILGPDGQIRYSPWFKTEYRMDRFATLSHGYQSTASLVIDIAARMFSRYLNSDNPLSEPGLVLIDEIDLHLHPKWQREVFNTLREFFPNVQFIVTTHSPLVIQAAPEANIVLLRRKGDHVVIDKADESIKNWRVDQILTSDLFGLPSARPPKLDAPLEERTRILGKARLTAKDKNRLAEIEQQISSLPEGETAEDMEAMDIIRRAANLIRDKAAAGK